jgi:DNA-binding transcriptional regulator YiaG
MGDDELARAVFARHVRMAREKTGLTQQDFSKRFRITLSRLRDWERARFKPDSVAEAYIMTILHNSKAVEKALALKQ